MGVARKHLSPKWDVFFYENMAFFVKKHVSNRKPDDVGNFFLHICNHELEMHHIAKEEILMFNSEKVIKSFQL